MTARAAAAAAASATAESPVQRRKMTSGDICPFTIPPLRLELDKGDAFHAARTVAEVCALLTQFRQLSELWLYQVQARECLREYLAKARARAESAVNDRLELAAAIARLGVLDRLYRLCNDLGIFTDVAYEQHLTPLGSSWDVDELPLQKFSTLEAKIAGTGLWKKYMRRRIQQYKRPEDQELESAVDTRFAIPLQAVCKRLVVKQHNCWLAAAARRALAQEKYKDLPLEYRGAASCMQAVLRRVFLLRRYAILRDACIEHGISILDDWKKLPAAQQLALYKHLQHGLDPKDPELDEFQAFVQTRTNQEGTVVPKVVREANAEEKLRSDLVPVVEDDVRPATPTFRNKDTGPNLTGEQLLGRDVHPEEGMRVVFGKAALDEFPDLLEDSGGGIGTITWVDPEDADGDGVTGDICEVLWDKTGLKGDYRTGFEGQFRLALVVSKRVRAAEDDGSEKLVGLDVEPVEGMRVVICKDAFESFPELLEDCGGTLEDPGVGIITWVDPEDADGDGVTGDICEVQWHRTGIKGDYRTGFEGDFRLALSAGHRKRKEGEEDGQDLIGIEVHPRVGMRVIFAKAALDKTPELLKDSGISSSGVLGAGIITWVDEEDDDGDGHTGDVCEVEWERTGITAKYDTGLHGNFNLAETVALENEIAGMKLQKVFRGHRSRRVLRNALIAKFLQEREMEEAYDRFQSALQLQNAIRCRHGRQRLRYERRLAIIYATESSVGPDPHTKVPLRLQSAFRGHISRGKLRSAILSIYMIKNKVTEAWTEERDTRAYIKRAYFILHTHPRIRSWRNHAVRMLAHVRHHATITTRYEVGVAWHAFCYWMQHSLDAKDRVDFVSLLIHRTWKHLLYMRLMRDCVYRWRFHTCNALWLDETGRLVAASHQRYLMLLKYGKTSDFALISRQQRESAFRLRAKITFAMCVMTIREWHICAWRRIVMRDVGDLMLPCWIEFLMWRCFCGLRFNGTKGQIVLSRAEISKFTLQQKMASVSKLSQSALIRFTKKRTGVKGPTKPIRRFIHEATAERTAAALHHNDVVYRPLLTSKTFPYPAAASDAHSFSDESERSEVSTPAYGAAASAKGKQRKQKKKYKTNEEIEASFWDARSRVLLSDSHSWGVPDGFRQPAALMTYTSMLPDLTRRPILPSGAQILAEKFNIDPTVLSSFERPLSEDVQKRSPSAEARSCAAQQPKRMAWEMSSFDDGYGEHPDVKQALRVSAASPVARNRLRSNLLDHPRSNTALGRLEAGRLPPL